MRRRTFLQATASFFSGVGLPGLAQQPVPAVTPRGETSALYFLDELAFVKPELYGFIAIVNESKQLRAALYRSYLHYDTLTYSVEHAQVHEGLRWFKVKVRDQFFMGQDRHSFACGMNLVYAADHVVVYRGYEHVRMHKNRTGQDVSPPQEMLSYSYPVLQPQRKPMPRTFDHVGNPIS